ncbi:DUF4307 domain-containing protein [Streptomyces sp. NBC_00237]|uniref:DUF4307 domain-containing protein n=1 Tax=Streptomyces sp. NBC_00237 TaxID=2975687 RepID=UPI0022543C9E|nr:DUF4307 domain-containing protein [Streptomyces sp. NBC_00237]MCX5204572.1 DUF4307 domain-containing protein [Streptomyces sp. NBC_00237]
MNAVRDGAPAGAPDGRYGRSADARADRKLKIIGSVLGVLLLLLVGWLGYGYISKQTISAELIKFDLNSSQTEVAVHLEIRKDADATGTCTVRAIAESGAEVGRKDVRIDQVGQTRIDEIYPIRTTAKATSAELLGCAADSR